MVLAYRDDLDSTVAQLSAWLQEGKIKVQFQVYVRGDTNLFFDLCK